MTPRRRPPRDRDDEPRHHQHRAGRQHARWSDVEHPTGHEHDPASAQPPSTGTSSTGTGSTTGTSTGTGSSTGTATSGSSTPRSERASRGSRDEERELPGDPRSRGRSRPPGPAIRSVLVRRSSLHRPRPLAGGLPDVELRGLAAGPARRAAPVPRHDLQVGGGRPPARRRQGRDHDSAGDHAVLAAANRRAARLRRHRRVSWAGATSPPRTSARRAATCG